MKIETKEYKVNGNILKVKNSDKVFRISTSYEKYAEEEMVEKKRVAKVSVNLIKVDGFDDDEKPIITREEPLAHGVSECSLKDQFNRKLGRRIAIGRAFKELII